MVGNGVRSTNTAMGDQLLDPIDVSDTSGSQGDGPTEPASSSAAPHKAEPSDQRRARKDTEEVPQPLSPDQQEMVSKRLSVVLRHDKGEFELRFDERALVPLEDVLRLPIMYKKRIDRKQIMSAIYHNDKKRFRAVIKDGKTFIGASQGHSFRINPGSVHTRTPTENVPALVHSTHYDFLQSILQHGIRPGGLREDHRQMVHCLEDKTSAARYYPPGVDVVLHISPQKTDATWYRSENDYYMTSETVPAKAIYKVSVVGSSDVVYAEGDRPPDLKAVAKAVLRVQSKGSRILRPLLDRPLSEHTCLHCVQAVAVALLRRVSMLRRLSVTAAMHRDRSQAPTSRPQVGYPESQCIGRIRGCFVTCADVALNHIEANTALLECR